MYFNYWKKNKTNLIYFWYWIKNNILKEIYIRHLEPQVIFSREKKLKTDPKSNFQNTTFPVDIEYM